MSLTSYRAAPPRVKRSVRMALAIHANFASEEFTPFAGLAGSGRHRDTREQPNHYCLDQAQVRVERAPSMGVED